MSEQITEIAKLTTAAAQAVPYRYDGNVTSMKAKAKLLTQWKGFVRKYQHMASDHSFNIVFTDRLTGAAAVWANDQDYEISHYDFVNKFATFFHTPTEQLSAYRELKNFNFSGRNFSKEYLDFKAIHDSLSEYAENDVHFTNHMYAALPQTIIDSLPSIAFASSAELYSMVASKSLDSKSFGPPASQSFDPDAMEIDALSASGIVSNEIYDVITQYQDAMNDPDLAEDLTVAFDAITTSRKHLHTRASTKTCFYCQKPGHFIKDCEKRLSELKSRTSNNPSYRQNYEAPHKPFHR